MSTRSMFDFVTGVVSSARMPETTIDSSSFGFAGGGVAFAFSSDGTNRKRKRASAFMFAFPYAGPNRIRFKGLISGRGVPRPPPGSDDCGVYAVRIHVGQTFLSGLPSDRPDKNVWPT